MTESVKPVRLAPEIYDRLGYLGTRLLFLNARYAPQAAWGDIALALDGFPTDNLDLSASGFWDEWRLRWSARADGYITIADRSNTVAGRSHALRSAAACYHWAEFMYFDDAELKLQLRQQLRGAFLASLEGADIELIQNELPARADRPGVPYWIVLPPERLRPDGALPAVILSNGLDSVTEVEVLSLAEAYLERGIAAVLFDGPGQGIQAGQGPVLIEMETVVAELVRRLGAEHPQIDTSRLAFEGISFGGYLALRVAVNLGDVFRCVVNFGGGPRVADFANLPRRLKDDFRFAFLAEGTDDIQDRFDALALEPGEPPATQVLSIHGALDDIFPVAALEELDRAWGPQHRLEVHAREVHVCLNVINVYTQQTADWVAELLAPTEQQETTRPAALTSSGS
ncbi:MAG: alpha/beta hydrolase family protein [Solirubrobacteraceae bacterium]